MNESPARQGASDKYIRKLLANQLFQQRKQPTDNGHPYRYQDCPPLASASLPVMQLNGRIQKRLRMLGRQWRPLGASLLRHMARDKGDRVIPPLDDPEEFLMFFRKLRPAFS
ncbi:hypothetical protein GCM10027428_00090 [Haliea atlantica]